jgi:hypothetical protein
MRPNRLYVHIVQHYLNIDEQLPRSKYDYKKYYNTSLRVLEEQQ